MTFTVQATHEQYNFNAPQWIQSDDFNKGEQAVKAKGKLYLPTPFVNVNDTATSLTEYDQFKEVAPFMAVTTKTLKGLAGTINRKPINTESIQPALEYLVLDSNGGGLPLNQHVSRTIEQVTLKGRNGLLTELPQSNKELSRLDNAKGAMPFIIGYKAEDIINWGLENNKLSYVVLRELVDKKIDDSDSLFGCETCFQYRVLLMNDGVYEQRIYSENNESINNFESVEVKFNGKQFDYIPFDFEGAENNDSNCDQSPMWPIVTGNKNHFYNSALDQNITTCCSLIMLAIFTEMDDQQIKDRFPQGITYGTRKGYMFGQGDDIKVIQATETNSASRKALEIIEELKLLGAALVEPSSNGTATEASIKSAGDGSVMSQISVNVEAAYNNQLANISLVLGVTTPSTIIVNKKLFDITMTPEMRRQWAADVTLGLLPKHDYYDALRESDQIAANRTNEQLDDESISEEVDSIPVTGDTE